MLTRRRYDRIAPFYDLIEWMMELRFRGWRRALWASVAGDRILELGVGTGKNLPFHPKGQPIYGVDISPKMLRRATRRAQRLSADVRFVITDVQQLPFEDASFDEVVATFLFCSVPDPGLGLQEALRVLRPGGRLLLLEHVLSTRPVLRKLMCWLDPIPTTIWGAHINRETVGAVRRAGFDIVECQDKALDVVKFIIARRPER